VSVHYSILHIQEWPGQSFLNPDNLHIVVIPAMIVIMLLFALVYARHYRKAGPNQVLVISGQKRTVVLRDGAKEQRGFRMVHGGGSFVMPVLERCDTLSLEPIPVELTIDNAAFRAQIAGQVGIGLDQASIATAACRLLGKTPEETGRAAALVIEQHARAVFDSLPAGEPQGNWTELAQSIREASENDLKSLGLETVSLMLREFRQQRIA
jgi:flotillin